MTSANVFAFPVYSLAPDSGHKEYFHTDQSRKAVLFEESVSESDVQISSENENDLHSFNPELFFNFSISYSYSGEHHYSEYQPNGKEQLKRHIFPSHFFW